MECLSSAEETQGVTRGVPLICRCGGRERGALSRIFSAGWTLVAGLKKDPVNECRQDDAFHNYTSAHFERGA